VTISFTRIVRYTLPLHCLNMPAPPLCILQVPFDIMKPVTIPRFVEGSPSLLLSNALVGCFELITWFKYTSHAWWASRTLQIRGGGYSMENYCHISGNPDAKGEARGVDEVATPEHGKTPAVTEIAILTESELPETAPAGTRTCQIHSEAMCLLCASLTGNKGCP
jgi:hypothetical protein